MNVKDLPEYITTKQLCEMTTQSESTVERQRSTGDGIPFIKLGKGRSCRVIYAKSDVLAYLEANKRKSTSEYED